MSEHRDRVENSTDMPAGSRYVSECDISTVHDHNMQNEFQHIHMLDHNPQSKIPFTVLVRKSL